MTDPANWDPQRTYDDLCAAVEHHTGRRVDPRSGTTLCPAHDDSAPSLSVRLIGGDDISVNCFAGCRSDDVLAAVGWDWTNVRRPPETADDRAPTDTYVYLDEHGEPLFRVLKRAGRDGKKLFWQERHENSGWAGGKGALDGVRRVPYRLPELLAAIGRGDEIYVAEGEKDVDALHRLGGVTATCNPHGAGKWGDECTQWFPPGTVVNIVADDDKPGTAHAMSVAASLRQAGCDALVWLPATGKDAFDHLAAGHTAVDFEPHPADDQQPDTESPHRKIGGVSFVNWPVFWANERTGDEWLCGPLLPLGRAVHIYAKRGTGKSDLTLFIAAHLATGRAVLDRPAGDPLRVGYLDHEMGDEDLYDRLTQMGFGPDDDLDNLYYSLLPNMAKLNTEKGGNDLQVMANDTDLDVLFVDSVTRVVAGKENEQETFNELLLHALNPLKRRGVTSVWTGNAGKEAEKGSRGSIGKEDVLDCVWELARSDAGAKLKNTKKRSPWVPDEVSLRRTDDGTLRYDVITESWPSGTSGAANALDRANVSLDASVRTAQKALREAGEPMRTEVISAGLKWRRDPARKGGNF